MGNLCGKQGTPGRQRKSKRVKALDARLAEVIVAKARANKDEKKHFKLAKLLLKFHELHQGFYKLRAEFERSGAVHGRLGIEQLAAAVNRLGYSMDAATFTAVAEAEDADGVARVTCEEFIPLEQQEALDPDVVRTLEIAEQTFMCFDSSSVDGYVDAGELRSSMRETRIDLLRPSPGGTGQDPITPTATKRFEELDGDGDGRVSFREFLFRLETWVADAEGTQEEEEEEEGAGSGGNAGGGAAAAPAQAAAA
eukprot:scaffold6.g2730.t1